MITACMILYKLLKSVRVHTMDKGGLQVYRFVSTQVIEITCDKHSTIRVNSITACVQVTKISTH